MSEQTEPSRPGPLDGIRIVDISSVLAGPFATHILADHGADVIKVESPEGDIMRQSGRSRIPAMAPIFQHLNRNKRAITLDLKSEADKKTLLQLVETADAFVYNMRPAAMARLGLDYDAVRAANPGIIYCGIVGFGEDGPYAGKPAYDDLIQGAVAIPDLMARSTGHEPHFVPFAIADRTVGLYASNAILMALVQKLKTGKGSAVSVPMFEATAHFLLVEHMFYRSFEPPTGEAINPRMLERQRRPFRTRDGHICVIPYTTKHWFALFDLFGRVDLKSDPRFGDFASRRENIAELYALLARHLEQGDTETLLSALEARDIPAVRSTTVEELLEDRHLQATGFFSVVEADDAHDAFVHMASPFDWAGWRQPVPRHAPLPSEHEAQIRCEIATPPGERRGNGYRR